MNVPKLGERWECIPSIFEGEHPPRVVVGRAIYVHERHRFVQVAYQLSGGTVVEGFKF